jgi:predicted acylesterase/phospholipase RssA
MGRRELGRRDRHGRQRPPSIAETLARATVLSSWERDAQAHQAADHVVTPEIGPIGLLEFDRIDEVVDAGRRAARELLASQPAGWLSSTS